MYKALGKEIGGVERHHYNGVNTQLEYCRDHFEGITRERGMRNHQRRQSGRVVESHVFSWSRSRFFKTAGVGVGFLKLLESESVFQNCWSRSRESESEDLLQLPTLMFIK